MTLYSKAKGKILSTNIEVDESRVRERTAQDACEPGNRTAHMRNDGVSQRAQELIEWASMVRGGKI